jgi:hypothetical protein
VEADVSDENVVPLPTEKERLIKSLQDSLKREAKTREDWIQIKLGQIRDMHRLRKQYPANANFGQECEANGLGEKVFNKTVRSYMIRMGEELALAEQVIRASDSWSLELIFREFFRLQSTLNTENSSSENTDKPEIDDQQAAMQAALNQNAQMKAQTQPKKRGRPRGSGKPTPPKPSQRAGENIPPKVQHALNIYDVMEGAGENITRKTLSLKANVSDGTANRAIIMRRLAKNVTPPPPPPPDPKTFARTTKEQFDRAVAKAAAEIRAQYAAMVQTYKDQVDAEMRAKWDEMIIPSYKRTLETAEAIRKHHKGVMQRADYNAILKCLHPDRVNAVTEAELSEAFRIFTKLKPVLVKATPEELNPIRMPTADELRRKR